MLYEYTLQNLHDFIDTTPDFIINEISAEFGAFFKVLQLSGCRPIEIVERNRWVYFSGTTYRVTTAKGSNTRDIDINLFPEAFKLWIDVEPLNSCGYSFVNFSTARRYFVDYFTPHHFYFNTDNANASQGMYIFRHMFFKDLFAQGYSIQQIKEITGEVDTKNVEGYLYSKAYGTTPPK